MSRKAFHQLLKRYVDGKCSAEERRLIDQWYRLLDDSAALPVNEEALDGIEEKLWNKIQHNIIANNKKVNTKLYSIVLKVAVAAVMVGLISLGVYYYIPSKKLPGILSQVTTGKNWEQIKNESAVVKKVLLEDGSIVSLQPGATLAYPKKFAAAKREVFLNGIALFKVSKNAERPFYVYYDNIVTQVLGTSFIIKKINDQIEVDVLTGKVAVFEKNKSDAQYAKTNGVVITPNQKVTYYTSNHQFITTLVENPVPVPAENTATKEIPVIKFMYDDALVSQVLSDLKEQYKIDILVENDKLNHCYFTGDINEQSLYNKLDLLCQAIQANYEIRGTSIVIDGKGCD